MKIINIKENPKYLEEYIKLCSIEWSKPKSKHEMDKYIKEKKNKILSEDKVITVLALIENNIMLGFISLFKYDGEERKDLTPWYATMYVKQKYRNKGYSKILNKVILSEAKKLGYKKVYLKTNLINYYEKFGAKFIEKLNNNENLYFIET